MLLEIERIVIAKMRGNRVRLRKIFREELRDILTKDDFVELKKYFAELQKDITALSKKIDTYLEYTMVYIEQQKLLEKQIEEITEYLDTDGN